LLLPKLLAPKRHQATFLERGGALDWNEYHSWKECCRKHSGTYLHGPNVCSHADDQRSIDIL